MIRLKRWRHGLGRSNLIWFATIFFIPLLLIVIWFRSGLLLGANESILVFYNSARTLESVSSSWSDIVVGYPTGITTAAAPTYFIFDMVSRFIGEPFVVQALFFLLIFVSSGVGVFALTRILFPNARKYAILFSIFFYWFNPISLVNVWWRFLYNYMVFFAFLPLAAAVFVKGIQSRRYVYGVVLGLLSGFFSYSLTSLPFNVLAWSVFVYLAFSFFFLDKRRTDRFFVFKFLAFCLIAFCLVNFWWLGQLFTFLGSNTFSGTISSFFASASNLSTLDALSAQLGNLTDVIRARHAVFFNAPFVLWASWYNSPLVSLLEFVLSGAILVAFIKGSRNKAVLIVGGLLLISVFLMKGTNPPFGEIFEIVFKTFSPFQVFRNPFEKFSFLFPLAAAPILAFFVDATTKRRRVHLLSLALLGVVILIWSLPFFAGLVFTRTDENDKTKVKSYGVEVPEYYSQVDDWLGKQGGDFRLAVFPLGPEGITYLWPHPYSGLELSNFLFSKPSVSLVSIYDLYYDLALAVSRNQLTRRVLSFMPFLNSKFIVWRGDVDFKQRRMADPATVKGKLDEWEAEGLLTRRLEAGELAVYEVNGEWFWPKVYATGNLYITNETDLGKISGFLENFPEEKAVVLREREVFGGISYDKLILTPKDRFLERVTVPTPKDLTEEDLLSRLFHAEHLPGKWYYPAVRLKEKIEEVSQDDYYGSVLYKTGILGKRAVEVHELYKENANQNLIKRAENDYDEMFGSMKPVFLGFVRVNNPVSRVVRDSLLYQWILLDRVNSPVANGLSQVLGRWGIKPKFELPVSDESYLVLSFDVPVSGDYWLSGVRLGDEGAYLNGKETQGLTTASIKLEEGENEIAFLLGEGDIDFQEVGIEEAEFSEKGVYDWEIDVPDSPTTYWLQFDYRFIRNDAFRVEFQQNIDRKESPVFSAGVVKDGNYHGWRHWEGEFTTSNGADNGVLRVVPTKEKVCERRWFVVNSCWEEEKEFEVEVRDFKLDRVDYPEVGLVLARNAAPISRTQVDFEKLDSTHYKVDISKPDGMPEMLVFSELFSSGWQAVFEDGARIPEDKHFLVNTYANGWLIGKPGNYKITLSFTPQELLNKGTKVSMVSVFAGLLFLGVELVRERRRDG